MNLCRKLQLASGRAGTATVLQLLRKATCVNQVRVGLITQILNSRYSPTMLLRASMLMATASGVDSYWVADHLNSLFPRSIATPGYLGVAKLVPKIDAQFEPWTMLGYLASRNRFARLRLGVGVTDTNRRHPAVTAQAAATLHLITRGRAILGIGVGEREGNEPYGVDWTKPVARFEEAIATIRALWNSRGEPISRESPTFLCVTRCLTCRPTVANGPRYGSPLRDRGCCEPPGATLTPGSPGWFRDPKTTHPVSKQCKKRRPTPGGTLVRSRRRCQSLSSPGEAATTSSRP